MAFRTWRRWPRPGGKRENAAVMRAQAVVTGVNAVVMRAHRVVVRAHALVGRADRDGKRLRCVAMGRKSMRRRVNRVVMAHNTFVMRHNTVAIVCNRVVRHADKVNSYNKRVVTHHNTVVIACNRICTLAGKEKTIVDGVAGVVSGEAALTTDLRRGSWEGPR